MSEFTVEDQAWAEELEKGVTEYTDSLFDAVFDGEEENIQTLSQEPFCGCSTCFWREALFFLVPRVIKGYQEGKLTLEE
ncbi:MAG: hypothetical protein EBT07_01595 [Actinobacteria bacterium]|nr:hypothetical protein [Actinomycetota bacterium]